MGAYISRGTCKSEYGIYINCTVGKFANGSIYSLGDIDKGKFQGDGDIAGIGIFSTFVGITSFALLLSLVVVICSMVKHRIFPFQRCGDGFVLNTETTAAAKNKIKPGISEICQGMVLSCSDAQIFTGAAYALTLRYFCGCTITAYHYNVVANLMLLSCATHLMAITVVRNYWEYAWLALLRVICKTGVFLFTGILLSNQNADMKLAFPTKVPLLDDTTTPLFLYAACFQSNDTQVWSTIDESLKKKNFGNAVFNSTPGNRIEGWNKFLIILLWYIVAVFMEIAMFIRKGNRRDGNRRRLTKAFWRVMIQVGRFTIECLIPKRASTAQCTEAPVTSVVIDTQAPERAPPRAIKEETSEQRTIRHLKWIGQYLLTLYYLIGIGICMWTVAASGNYIGKLKQWVQDSGWLDNDDKGANSENDATSFGQLVPLFTSGLVVFTFLEMISTSMSRRKDAKERLLERSDEEQPLPPPPQNPYKYEYTSATKPVLTTPSPEVSQQPVEGTTSSQAHHGGPDTIPSYFPPSSEPIVAATTESTEPVSPPLELSSEPVPSQVDTDGSTIDQTVGQATSKSAVSYEKTPFHK
ncbi:hypothetical protein FAVG1_09077 [Fusarium avenaceum]|nr:hypothetical protein FAVG1_09077 [Fusarium avenaceum]